MAEDLLFQEAVQALREGKKTTAREKLTLLLKAEQTNSTYWLWMSATVDTNKERIYCLQTALKLDPKNDFARRGLILSGALPPDESIPPFPVNRPRLWEQKLLLATEQPRPTGFKALASNPTARLAGLSVMGVAVCGFAYFAMTLPRRTNFGPIQIITAGPSPTFTTTPTFVNATGQPTPTFLGPTPLWMLLPATYTPTPLYVNTPRQPDTHDQFRLAKAALAVGDYETYIRYLKDIGRLEPDSADVYYYIGEAYRFQGFHNDALEAYNHALEIDPRFGPAYLGLARARLNQDPNSNVEYLLDQAIERDPDFGEIYLERANYFLYNKEYGSALADLQSAEKRMPDSPSLHLTYAKVYLARKENAEALERARKANELDLTILEAYLVRGQAAVLQGEYQEAIKALETYIIYKPKDGVSLAAMGECYFQLKKYEQAIAYLDRAIPLLDYSPPRHRSYLYRGLAHLELDEIDEAEYDLENAYEVLSKNFDVNIGLVRVDYARGEFGNAYLKAFEAEALAETGQQHAQVYFWRAMAEEKSNKFSDALRDWNALLALPDDVVGTALRVEAQRHMNLAITPTSTVRSQTKSTGTPKPSVTRTGTPTAAPPPTVTPKP